MPSLPQAMYNPIAIAGSNNKVALRESRPTGSSIIMHAKKTQNNVTLTYDL